MTQHCCPRTLYISLGMSQYQPWYVAIVALIGWNDMTFSEVTLHLHRIWKHESSLNTWLWSPLVLTPSGGHRNTVVKRVVRILPECCHLYVADVNISVTDGQCQNKRHVVASVSMRGRRTCVLTADVFVQPTQTSLHLPKGYQKVKERIVWTNTENIFIENKKAFQSNANRPLFNSTCFLMNL